MRTELDECGVRRTYQLAVRTFSESSRHSRQGVFTQSWLAFQSEVIGAQGIM